MLYIHLNYYSLIECNWSSIRSSNGMPMYAWERIVYFIQHLIFVTLLFIEIVLRRWYGMWDELTVLLKILSEYIIQLGLD